MTVGSRRVCRFTAIIPSLPHFITTLLFLMGSGMVSIFVMGELLHLHEQCRKWGVLDDVFKFTF